MNVKFKPKCFAKKGAAEQGSRLGRQDKWKPKIVGKNQLKRMTILLTP
jgi:hypothetical protein